MSEGDDMAQDLNQFRELGNQLRSLSEVGKRDGRYRAGDHSDNESSGIL